MNIIDLQESLKDYPDNRLMAEYQRPTNNIPQFLILSELQRRKRMRDDFKRREAADEPTVAEEMITGVGVPQEGLTTLASALTPNTALSQDTGTDQAMPMQATRASQQPQMAADGGILNLFTGGRTREDLYRRVEPFPENGTAAERRNWTLTYGMTHDADGMPKRMPSDVATTDVSPFQQGLPYAFKDRSPFISDVSADIGDFVPSPITSEIDQLVNQGKSPNLNNISRVGSLPFLPSGSLGIGADTDTEDLLETMLKANEGIARDELPESADSDLRFSRGTASTNALKDAVIGSGISSSSINPSSVVGDLPFLPPPTSNISSELPIRGADTDPAQQLAEFLASRRSDLPGVNLPGESNPYIIDPDAAGKQGQAILDSEARRLAERALQGQEGSFDQPNSLAINTDTSNSIGSSETVSPMSYDDLLKKAQSGMLITENDIVQSVEAGLLNDQQAADINSIIDDPSYMPSQIEQDIANNPADLSFPDVPTNPNLLFPKIAGGISDYVGGVFGGRTVGEQAEIDAARKRQAEEYDKYIQSGGFAGAVKGIEAPVGSTTDANLQKMLELEPLGKGMGEENIIEMLRERETAEEALQNQEDSFTQPDPLAFIDSVTDGGAGGAGFGSPESEIAKLLSDRRKRADQNKWLSLAEAGFAMMGPAATLGEGISKGGRAGLKALRDSQKGMDAFESDMLKLQTSLDIAQQRSADTRYGADTRAATARYSADQALESSKASTKARLESVEQRKRKEVADNIANIIAIIDSDIDRLGIAPGATAKDIDPLKLDAYDKLIEERNKQLAQLKAITGTAIEDAGSSDIFGKFNVTS